MGETHASPEEVQQVVQNLGDSFRGTSYHLLQRNCNHFSDMLCERLTGHQAPPWVSRWNPDYSSHGPAGSNWPQDKGFQQVGCCQPLAIYWISRSRWGLPAPLKISALEMPNELLFSSIGGPTGGGGGGGGGLRAAPHRAE